MLFQEPEGQTEYGRLVEREVSQQEGEDCSGEPRNDCAPSTAPGRRAGEVGMSPVQGSLLPPGGKAEGLYGSYSGGNTSKGLCLPAAGGRVRPENWGDGMNGGMRTDTHTADTMCRIDNW